MIFKPLYWFETGGPEPWFACTGDTLFVKPTSPIGCEERWTPLLALPCAIPKPSDVEAILRFNQGRDG